MAFSIGGSKGSSKSFSSAFSEDTSQSSSFGKSSQTIAFEDLFKTLYGNALDTSGRLATQVPTYQGEAAQLFTGGIGLLESLQGPSAESDYLSSRVSGENPLLGEQISGLQTDLGRLFREELLPAITSGAVSGNTLGGGRQGVAQGLAAERIGREFTRGVTELRAGDMEARDAAARDLLAQRSANAGIGLGSLEGILGLAESGLTAEALPVSMLAQILGGPTTLTESLSGSEASSYGVSRATSTSKSKSGSFGFGL